MSEIAKFFYENDGKKVTTNLKSWLSKRIEFNEVRYANFGNIGNGIDKDDNMMLAVVGFDKDHCIYLLMEKDCFKPTPTQEEKGKE